MFSFTLYYSRRDVGFVYHDPKGLYGEPYDNANIDVAITFELEGKIEAMRGFVNSILRWFARDAELAKGKGFADPLGIFADTDMFSFDGCSPHDVVQKTGARYLVQYDEEMYECKGDAPTFAVRDIEEFLNGYYLAHFVCVPLDFDDCYTDTRALLMSEHDGCSCRKLWYLDVTKPECWDEGKLLSYCMTDVGDLISIHEITKKYDEYHSSHKDHAQNRDLTVKVDYKEIVRESSRKIRKLWYQDYRWGQ